MGINFFRFATKPVGALHIWIVKGTGFFPSRCCGKGLGGGFTKKTMVSKSKDFSNLNVEEYRTGFFPSRCCGKGLGGGFTKKTMVASRPVIFVLLQSQCKHCFYVKQKNQLFLAGFLSSGNWTRTSDLRVMSRRNTGFIWSHMYLYNG